MNIRSTRERLLASTMIVGAMALAGAGQAMAQATAPVSTAPQGASGAPAFGPASAAPAAAPVTEGATGQPQTAQIVTVTGSRIPQPNLASTSPVTSVGGAELKLEGTTDVVNALDQLPETNGDLGNSQNALGSTGITTVNLRGLGANRTLVLQDGKRVMPGDQTTTIGGAADIDQIPTGLVDRIEVVTGGASATYGSDALAGVVNFVMKHNFQGVQFDVEGAFNQHNNDNSPFLQGLEGAAGFAVPTGSVADGQAWTASALFGANTPDGKGNVEGFISYHHQDPVTQGERSYSACELIAVGPKTPFCDGSSNSNYFQDLNPGTGGNQGQVFTNVGNSLLSYPQAGSSPPPVFNSSPYEYLTRQDERYNAATFAHYQIAPWAELYNDFNFMDDRTSYFIAPSGIFRGLASPGNTQGGLTVPCDDPLLSAQEVATICTADGLTAADNASLQIGRRNVEGGPRSANYEHMSFRDVLGMRGDLGDAWHYDAYAQYGYVKIDTVDAGYLSNTRLENAVDVVPNPATGGVAGVAAGAPVCAVAVAGTDTNCVPYNIFNQGGVTSQALNYLNDFGETQGSNQEQVAHFDITGQLGQYGVQSPFATRGVGVNLGAEYRREQFVYTPDETTSSGDLAGGNGGAVPVVGAFDVYEVFGEAVVPLANDQPFIHDLTFDGGYRFSDYSSIGSVESYKASLEYAPIRDIRFRGSFQRAVRAPNTVELFTGQEASQSPVLTTDPCAAVGSAGNVASATLAQCLNTVTSKPSTVPFSPGSQISAAAFTAAYGNGIAAGSTVNGVAGTSTLGQCPANQCGDSYGGNTSLKAETSDTVTYGGILTPRFLPGFDFSVDYFNIKVKDAIESLANYGTQALAACINGTDTALCNDVVRNASGGLFNSGALQQGGYVIGLNENAGFLRTAGFETAANYRYNLAQLGYGDLGRLAVSFDGTYTTNFTDSPLAGLGSFNCAGYYGSTCGGIPRWKSKLRLTYTSPMRWSLSAQWRYIGAMKLDQNQSNPLLQYSEIGTFDNYDASRPAINYLDLTATWQVNDILAVRAGVNNVLDKDPPILAQDVVGIGNPNTALGENAPGYDLLGRSIYVGLTANF